MAQIQVILCDVCRTYPAFGNTGVCSKECADMRYQALPSRPVQSRNSNQGNSKSVNSSVNSKEGDDYLIQLHLSLPPYNRMEKSQAIEEIKRHCNIK